MEVLTADWRAAPCKVKPGPRTKGGYHKTGRSNPRRNSLLHRDTWEREVGPIPPGMCVLHRCDNPPCHERLHLFLGTQKDNVDDMLAKGRGGGQKRTHCPEGHLYAGENLIIERTAKGTCRRCRTCRRAADRRRRRPAKAAA